MNRGVFEVILLTKEKIAGARRALDLAAEIDVLDNGVHVRPSFRLFYPIITPFLLRVNADFCNQSMKVSVEPLQKGMVACECCHAFECF